MQMGGRGAVADVAAGVMDNLIAVRPPRHLQPPQPLAAIRAVMWVIGTMVIYTLRYKFHWTGFVPFIFYCLNNQVHAWHMAGEVEILTRNNLQSWIPGRGVYLVSSAVWLVMKTLCAVITANCGLIIQQ